MSDSSAGARAAAAAEVEGILDRRVGAQGTPTDDDLKPVFFFLVPSGEAPASTSERRHWYCSRAGGLERRAATYLVVLFAFKQQGTSKVWIDTLEGVLQGCAECARAFPVARRTWERLYFSKYPAQTRNNFFKAVDRWQAGLVAERLDAGDALLDLPPPLLQLAFNEPGVLASERLSGALDAAIALAPTARTAVADHPLMSGLAHLLSSPSAPRRAWARAQLAAIRKPVAYDELRDGGLGDQLATLLSPSFPGTQAELWATLSSLLSTDRLGVDAVQRALLAGQYTPDTPRPDRSAMAAIARHIGTPGDSELFLVESQLTTAFEDVFRCFTAALRLSPTHHIWAFDTSPEFPRTLFSEIKENSSFEALAAGAQPSSSKGKGKEGALDASPFAFIPNFLLSVLDVAATNDASGFPGALAKAMSFLFGEMQHDRLLESARAAAAEAGCKERITSKDAGMAALTSVFEVHPGFIARVAFQLNTDAVWASPRAAARDLIAQVFKVDGREILESVMGLAVIASAERRRLKRKRRAKPGQAIPEPVAVDKLHRAVIRRELWRAAYDAFSPTDADGLVLLMTAVAPFAHVEKLNLAEAWDPRDLKEVVQAQEWTASVRAINTGLTSIRTDFARVLESLAAQADPLVLGSLWKLPGVAKQAVILLLSPAESIHEPVINLVQQSFDVDDRADCFRTMLATYSADAMDGLYTFLSSFIHSARIVPDSTSLAKWLVRCFTDIMDALCEADDSHPPLLQAEAFLNIYANGRWMTRRVSDLWQLMTDSLALIFRRTADWAPYYENEVMVDWMRDALIFGRMITDNIRIFESAILSRAGPKTADPSESPARMSHVAKGLVAKLEVVLADLVGWLRLTDAETLHQAFELIKTILGRIAKTKPDLAHNPKLEATLLELDKFCRRVSSAYNCRLSDDLLSELSDMLSVFDLPADEDEVQFIKEVKARSPEVVSDADSITSKLRAAAIKEQPIKGKDAKKETKDTKTPPSSQGQNAFAMMMKKAGGTYSPSESTRPKQAKPVKPRQMTLDEFEAQDDFLDKLSANDLEILEKRAQNTSNLTRPNAVKPAKPARDRLVLNVTPKLYPEKKPLSSSKFTSKLMRDLSREHKAARSGMAQPPPPRLPNASAIGTGIGAYTGPKPKPKPKPESESSASESSSDEENKGLSALLARQKAPVAAKPAPPRFTINERRPIKTIGSDATDIIRQREEQRRRQHNIKMRLRPDMTPLFRFVLAWDPTSTSSTPPYSQRAAMQLGPLQPVPTTFASPQQYDKVMLPLFLHELWAQFLKDDVSSPGVTVEVTAKDYEDDFLDYSANVKGDLPPKFSLNDADIVTVQHHGPNSRPVFAKVQVFRRKFKDAAIKLRVLQEADPGTMGVGAKLLVKKHASLSTAMREFGALRGLPYYEPAILSDTLKAHCAAMPTLSEAEVEDAMRQHQVNEPQARAILGAMRVRGFSLIQGPPGTGKTKTISGLVGKFMSDRTVPIATQGRVPDKPKILVCAPSNAAIDEVCKRLMEGVPSSHGERLHPKIVRIGIESSVNVAVKDVSLDNIVEARVNTESQRRDGGGTDLARIQTELADVRRQIKDKQDEAAAVKSNEQKSKALAEELQVLNMRRTKLGQQSSKAKDAARDATRHLDGARRAARETVLKEADVICATLSGSGQDVLSPFTFDTVIIDEAAQAIEMSCLIPLKYGCARCVMVGDPNQLPPTTFTAEADRFKFNQSLFVRIAQNKTAPMHLLSIQYRMHPDISTLPSKLFYQGRLKDGDGMAKKTLARWHKTPMFGPYHFINVSGTEVKAGTSTKNTEEARVAVELYRNLERQYGDVTSFAMRIGVITMYKEQLYELKRRFTEAFGQGIVDTIDFNTVDGFQGQEKDIIILSCVRSGPNLMSIGFLKDFRRMNVALTRAKSSLFVIGSAATLERSDPRWSTIVGDARDRRLLVDYAPDLFSRRAITNGDDDGNDADVSGSKKNRKKRVASPDPSGGAIPKVQAVRDARGREGDRKRKADDAEVGPAKKQRSSPAVDAGPSTNGKPNGAPGPAQGRRDSRASMPPTPARDPPPPPSPKHSPPPSPPADPPTTAPPPAPAPSASSAGAPRPAPPPRPREAKEVLFMRKKKPAPRPTAPPGGATNVRAVINNSLAGGARGMGGSHSRGGGRGGAPPPPPRR